MKIFNNKNRVHDQGHKYVHLHQGSEPYLPIIQPLPPPRSSHCFHKQESLATNKRILNIREKYPPDKIISRNKNDVLSPQDYIQLDPKTLHNESTNKLAQLINWEDTRLNTNNYTPG